MAREDLLAQRLQWFCYARCTMHNMHNSGERTYTRPSVSKTSIAGSPRSAERELSRINNRRQIPPFSARYRRKTMDLHACGFRILHIHSTATMIPLQTFRAGLSRRCFAPTITVRKYASQTPGNPMLEVFNRKVKHLQKDRAARNVEESRKVDYLKDEVAMRLCERLLVSYLAKQARKKAQK